MQKIETLKNKSGEAIYPLTSTKAVVDENGNTVEKRLLVADGEDLVTDGNVLRLKDRPNTDGMGYVILRKNKTFQEQVTKPNTIYEIRYDFDLGRQELPVVLDTPFVLPSTGGAYYRTGDHINVEAGMTVDLPSGGVLFDSTLSAIIPAPYTPSSKKSLYVGKLQSEAALGQSCVYSLHKDVVIPENCVLDFQGGSLSNGTVVGNGTAIDAPCTKIFDNISMDRYDTVKWIGEGNVVWFGADNTGIEDSYDAMQNCINAFSCVYIPYGKYSVSRTLLFWWHNSRIYGDGRGGARNTCIYPHADFYSESAPIMAPLVYNDPPNNYNWTAPTIVEKLCFSGTSLDNTKVIDSCFGLIQSNGTKIMNCLFCDASKYSIHHKGSAVYTLIQNCSFVSKHRQNYIASIYLDHANTIYTAHTLSVVDCISDAGQYFLLSNTSTDGAMNLTNVKTESVSALIGVKAKFSAYVQPSISIEGCSWGPMYADGVIANCAIEVENVSDSDTKRSQPSFLIHGLSLNTLVLCKIKTSSESEWAVSEIHTGTYSKTFTGSIIQGKVAYGNIFMSKPVEIGNTGGALFYNDNMHHLTVLDAEGKEKDVFNRDFCPVYGYQNPQNIGYDLSNLKNLGKLYYFVSEKKHMLCAAAYNKWVRIKTFDSLDSDYEPTVSDLINRQIDTYTTDQVFVSETKKSYYHWENRWYDGQGNEATAKSRGSSDERPTRVCTGFVYYDESIQKPIVWNGTEWIEADGNRAGIHRAGIWSQRPNAYGSYLENGFQYFLLESTPDTDPEGQPIESLTGNGKPIWWIQESRKWVDAFGNTVTGGSNVVNKLLSEVNEVRHIINGEEYKVLTTDTEGKNMTIYAPIEAGNGSNYILQSNNDGGAPVWADKADLGL